MPDLINFLNHHMMETYAIAGLLVLLMIIEYLRLKRHNFSVQTTKAIELINRENATVIDLRSKERFSTGHIVGSHLINSNDVQENPKKIEKFRSKPLLLVCDNGVESQKTAASWTKKGYNVYSLSGGLRSWTDAGLPLVKE